MSAKQVIADLKAFASVGKAAELQRFFKTGPGDYADGDIFIGVVVPQTRKVAARYKDLPITEIAKLSCQGFRREFFSLKQVTNGQQ